MTTSDHDAASASFYAQLEARASRALLLLPTALEGALMGANFRTLDAAKGSATSEPDPGYTVEGGVAVVTVDGALAQRAWSCFIFGGDGYDAITARIGAALADPAVSAVMLSIDSPGGEVAGCFEAVRAIRTAADEAGKPLVAYANEMAASAAYALACACSAIVVPDTGLVGSIGVIAAVTERTGELSRMGRKVHLITSGAHKADGHPAVELSDEARGRMQGEVDHLASVFFAEVAKARPLSMDDAKGLEAGVRYGAAAVDAGLADQVGNSNDAMALARRLAVQGRKDKTMKKTAQRLGLAEDATEDKVLAALDARDPAPLLAALGVESVSAALPLVVAHKSSHEALPALKAKVETQELAATKSAHGAAVEAGHRARKISKAQLEAYRTGKGGEAELEFAAVLNGMSAGQVDALVKGLHELPAAPEGAASRGGHVEADGLTAEDIAAGQKAGLTREQLAAAKKKLAAHDAG